MSISIVSVDRNMTSKRTVVSSVLHALLAGQSWTGKCGRHVIESSVGALGHKNRFVETTPCGSRWKSVSPFSSMPVLPCPILLRRTRVLRAPSEGVSLECLDTVSLPLDLSLTSTPCVPCYRKSCDCLGSWLCFMGFWLHSRAAAAVISCVLIGDEEARYPLSKGLGLSLISRRVRRSLKAVAFTALPAKMRGLAGEDGYACREFAS